MEKSLKRNLTQEVGDENQTDWEDPYIVTKGINDVVQGRPSRPTAKVLLQRRFASSERTGLRRRQCYAEEIDSTCLLYTSRCV